MLCFIFRDRLKSCLTVCGYEVVNLGELFAREEAASEEIRPRKVLLHDLYKKVQWSTVTQWS